MLFQQLQRMHGPGIRPASAEAVVLLFRAPVETDRHLVEHLSNPLDVLFVEQRGVGEQVHA